MTNPNNEKADIYALQLAYLEAVFPDWRSDFMNNSNECKTYSLIMSLVYLLISISVVSLVIIIMLVSEYGSLMPRSLRIGVTAVAFLMFALGIVGACIGECKAGYYKCKHCGEHFVPTMGQYIWGVHIFTTRRLTCPHCHQRDWCKKVMSKED